MIHPSRIDKFKSGLASGRGVLILGPAFARSYDSLDMSEVLESTYRMYQARLVGIASNTKINFRMCVQSLGNDALGKTVCVNAIGICSGSAYARFS